MPDFDLTSELSLKIELHMLRPITEKVHSGNGPVSLVQVDPKIFGLFLPLLARVTLCVTKQNLSISCWS